MDWINLAQHRKHRMAIMKTVLNLGLHEIVGNF
jgi:hypothetical protein